MTIIGIVSLICSIAVTVSVIIALKISFDESLTEIDKIVNDFKTEVNHKFGLLEVRLTNIETKINAPTKEKIDINGPNNGSIVNGDDFTCKYCHGIYTVQQS